MVNSTILDPGFRAIFMNYAGLALRFSRSARQSSMQLDELTKLDPINFGYDFREV